MSEAYIWKYTKGRYTSTRIVFPGKRFLRSCLYSDYSGKFYFGDGYGNLYEYNSDGTMCQKKNLFTSWVKDIITTGQESMIVSDYDDQSFLINTRNFSSTTTRGQKSVNLGKLADYSRIQGKLHKLYFNSDGSSLGLFSIKDSYFPNNMIGFSSKGNKMWERSTTTSSGFRWFNGCAFSDDLRSAFVQSNDYRLIKINLKDGHIVRVLGNGTSWLADEISLSSNPTALRKAKLYYRKENTVRFMNCSE